MVLYRATFVGGIRINGCGIVNYNRVGRKFKLKYFEFQRHSASSIKSFSASVYHVNL
jgi:hypothetical protein